MALTVSDWKISKAVHMYSGSFCSFPINTHLPQVNLIQCTKLCFTTPGCYSFNFLPQDGGTGECVTVAPSGGENLNFQPDTEDVWKFYVLSSFVDRE